MRLVDGNEDVDRKPLQLDPWEYSATGFKQTLSPDKFDTHIKSTKEFKSLNNSSVTSLRHRKQTVQPMKVFEFERSVNRTFGRKISTDDLPERLEDLNLSATKFRTSGGLKPVTVK